MCTSKVEKSCIFTFCTCFSRSFTPLCDFLGIFWRIFHCIIFKSKVLTAQENELFEGQEKNSKKSFAKHSSPILLMATMICSEIPQLIYMAFNLRLSPILQSKVKPTIKYRLFKAISVQSNKPRYQCRLSFLLIFTILWRDVNRLFSLIYADPNVAFTIVLLLAPNLLRWTYCNHIASETQIYNSVSYLVKWFLFFFILTAKKGFGLRSRVKGQLLGAVKIHCLRELPKKYAALIYTSFKKGVTSRKNCGILRTLFKNSKLLELLGHFYAS